MKKIFISRSLKPASPIRKIISDDQLVDKSLIQFSALDFEAPQADWIFFYSRNGVKYFFENGNFALYPYLWACMSKGTADELSQYITDISFVGNGNPEEVAASYQDFLEPGAVTCFIRAENSIDSIYKHLNQKENFSLPVYRNTPITELPKSEFDILIFTSPMNADVWFDQNEYKNEIVLAIGSTTAQWLINTHGIHNVIIAESPSEASIAKSLESLINTI